MLMTTEAVRTDGSRLHCFKWKDNKHRITDVKTT